MCCCVGCVGAGWLKRSIGVSETPLLRLLRCYPVLMQSRSLCKGRVLKRKGRMLRHRLFSSNVSVLSASEWLAEFGANVPSCSDMMGCGNLLSVIMMPKKI